MKYTLNNKQKDKLSRRNRIPRTRDVRLDNNDYDLFTRQDCINNIESLLVAYQAVFRNLTSVSLIFTDNLSPHYIGTYLVSIQIEAVNPANQEKWSQYFEVNTAGDIIVFGGQREAAWSWRFTYWQKCWRALAGWLKNIAEQKLVMKRTQSRLQQIKQELMEVVWAY